MAPFPAFIGPSYQSQAVTFDQELTLNWYTEVSETPGTTSHIALYPTPGVQQFTPSAGLIPDGTGRAHKTLTINGVEREFAVIGPNFGEILIDGSFFPKGLVMLDDGEPATISYNGDGGGQVLVTSGGNAYLFFDAAGPPLINFNSSSQIAALVGKATMADFLDGFFIVLDAATSTFYVSDLLDGLSWPGTQFVQRTTALDPWVAVKVVNKYIWLVGTETSDVFYDAGTSPVPFSPDPSAGLIPYGTSAPWSVASAEAALVWLGRSSAGEGQVIRASGFTPEIVSTFAVSNRLNSYTSLDDGIAFTYSDRGHTFYVLTLPSATKTWCWDFQMEQWHERGTWDSDLADFEAWRPAFHALAFGQHRILDRAGPGIYQLSSDFSADVDSEPIRRVRRSPAMVNELQRLFYSDFELDLEPGLGLTVGQGSDPQVMLRMSNDGGKTWSFESWRSAGKIGEYSRRVRWNRCGAARRRVFEVSVSDPIPYRITNAFITVQGEQR